MERSKSRRRDAGMTLLELTVATTLVVAVAGFLASTVRVVTVVNEHGENQLRESSIARVVLTELRRDLQRTTFERNKKTNLPRFTVINDAAGNQEMIYEMLRDVRMIGTEIEADWSPQIRVWLDAKTKQLVRRENDLNRILANGVRALKVETTLDGRIHVELTTERRNTAGVLEPVHRKISVKPAY